LKALVAPPHGSHSFDSRTIEKIVAKLDLKGVRGWIKYLKSFILGEANEDEEDDAEIAADGTIAVKEAEDEKSVTAKRIWAFDQLLHIVKANTVQKDDEVLAGLLEFFAVLGWFQIRKSGKGAVSYFDRLLIGDESLLIASSS
jgi:DNA polymerase phi